jgi:hypothetical protein
MDNSQKAQTRAWAVRQYRRTLILLPVMALVFAADWWYMLSRVDAENHVRANVTLAHAASAVVNEFVRFYFQQTRELISYPPPADPAAHDAWAESIEQHFGQPVAVFRVNDSEVRWVRMPEPFRADSARLDLSVRVEENMDNRGRRTHHDIGGMEILHWTVDAPPAYRSVWMTGPRASAERWGAVLGVDATWNAMIRDMQRQDSVPALNSPRQVLAEEVELSPLGRQMSKPGLQIIRKGTVIFSSPGLDTTQYCYTSGSSDLTTKLYRAKIDGVWNRVERWRVFSHLLVALVILTFLPAIRRWQKKVLLLTEPGDKIPFAESETP